MSDFYHFKYKSTIILFVFTAFIFTIAGCFQTNQKIDKAGKYVLKVLKAKYHKDFKIKSGHFISNTGGYEFTVYPKNTLEFTFTAWLNGMTESGESDEYFLAHRFFETIQMVKPYLDAISKDNYFSAAAIEPGNLPDYKEMVASIHKHLYSNEQMLSAFPNKISITLQIHINYNITPENEDSVLKKVYKLIKFLKDKKFGSIQLAIFFYDFPGKSIRILGHNNVNFSLDNMFKAKYWLDPNSENIKSLNNWKELKQYLRKPIYKQNMGIN